MMRNEVKYDKYKHGQAYHWQQISKSLRYRNIFVIARYKLVLENLKSKPEQIVLDVGGGDGALSFQIAKSGARPIIVDTSEDALRFADQEFLKRKLKASVVNGNVYDLPLPSNYIDASVCCDVIEHVRSPEKLLSEVYRVLKPGGMFVITTPLRITEVPNDKFHVREYFSSELFEIIASIFDEVSVSSFAPIALKDLYNLNIRFAGNKRLFRTLFNAIELIFKYNLFLSKLPFAHQSMLIATAQKI